MFPGAVFPQDIRLMGKTLMIMKRVLFILAFLSFSLVSCEIDDPVSPEDLIPRKDIVLTKSQSEFVRSNNGFALDLFKRVSQKENGKSLLISPLSVTIDFGMVNNGAVGQTQKEIYETLGYGDGSVEGLNDFCHTMMEQSAAVDPSTTLEIANAAVVNKLYPGLKDSFTNTVKSVYDAEVIYKDFGKEDVKKLINDWCDRKTHGMIPELLMDPVPASSYAHFLNAVYFKGIWASKFKKEDTKKAHGFLNSHMASHTAMPDANSRATWLAPWMESLPRMLMSKASRPISTITGMRAMMVFFISLSLYRYARPRTPAGAHRGVYASRTCSRRRREAFPAGRNL